MTLVAKRAALGKWFDTSRPVSREAALAFKADGFVGVSRTLPLPRNDSRYDISKDELLMLCEDVGLEVSLYQHVRGFPPLDALWDPAEHDGDEDAKIAAGHALGCDAPAGMHIWQDFEAIKGSGDATVIFGNDWGKAMVGSRFKDGKYVGYAVPLSADRLYNDFSADSYWSDAGPRVVAVRGFCAKQGKQVAMHGMLVDLDEVFLDQKGEVFFSCARLLSTPPPAMLA
jgi:hypothetical protein